MRPGDKIRIVPTPPEWVLEEEDDFFPAFYAELLNLYGNRDLVIYKIDEDFIFFCKTWDDQSLVGLHKDWLEKE